MKIIKRIESKIQTMDNYDMFEVDIEESDGTFNNDFECFVIRRHEPYSHPVQITIYKKEVVEVTNVQEESGSFYLLENEGSEDKIYNNVMSILKVGD